jgi:flagellin
MASIINNIGALNSQRNLAKSQGSLNTTINRLSTGLRINRASDDAAGLQISNNLRADVRVLNQARRNANDGLGRLAVQDLVAEEASNLLSRASELAEQAASGTTTSAGRAALNQEFTQIKEALNALDSDTKFDGQEVFGQQFTVRVGEASTEAITVSAFSIDSTTLAINADTLLTSGTASTALGNILSAISTVSEGRGNVGAKSARLETIVNSLGISSENITAAESQIRDADIASEVVNLTKFQILSQSGVSALSQANQSAQSVLSLLG